MVRSFRIEEIMLEGISGEVRGTFRVDPQSGLIHRVRADTFLFRETDTDMVVELSASQRSRAIEVVERTLAAAEVTGVGATFVGSAEVHSPPTSVSASTRVLAEYLGSPRQHVVPSEGRRRAE